MTEIATFAAGCFWGVEQAFRETDGVVETEAGYIGGRTTNPTYREVCSKTTGHAEAVKVTFDPAKISYDALLGVFWRIHNPTEINRQGPDIGSQYRSAIFTHNDDQAARAAASKQAEDKSARHNTPIATTIEPAGIEPAGIEPAGKWWKAEDDHQQYFEKRGGGTCSIGAL